MTPRIIIPHGLAADVLRVLDGTRRGTCAAIVDAIDELRGHAERLQVVPDQHQIVRTGLERHVHAARPRLHGAPFRADRPSDGNDQRSALLPLLGLEGLAPLRFIRTRPDRSAQSRPAGGGSRQS